MRRTQRGFSLLELLVACAIMAIALGMLYRATGGSARAVAEVDIRQRATVLAESLLALCDAVPPGGWRQQGRSGDLAWSIQSAPYASGIDASRAPMLHEVSIAISWTESGAAHQFELQTLRPERRVSSGERLR